MAQAGVARAATLESLEFSADVTVTVGEETATDHDVIIDDLNGNTATASLGPLPEGVALAGYSVAADGDMLFSVDSTTVIGGITATPRDVVRFANASYSIALDGSAEGIPEGAAIDAVAIIDGDIAVSFDIAARLDAALVVGDEDLVRLQAGTFSILFDGSAAGVPDALDVDAAHVLENGHVLVSFDGSGSVGGVGFDDEDVLEHDGQAWQIQVDGSDAHAALAAADVAAISANEAATVLCADTNNSLTVTASDALFILQAAVGTQTCADCVCDVNGNGDVTASDSLLALRIAVGQPALPACPACS